MASTSESSDGPVLTVLSKRIRNLRKKLNRITQIEQSQNPIKNKEQQDLLLSKPSLVAVIDELEKLRLPLTAAVDEELKNTVFLNEGDLDLLTEMSELLVSRPANSSFSHEDALRRCVGHARNWIAGSEERIDENSNVT
nr:hypothetical protein [Tanacetum cinerariifolium]